MHRLLLIRHAKAAAFGREPGDHARPLSDKGHRDALALGQILADAGWTPDVGAVSNALRTVQTWDDMKTAFAPCPVHFEEVMYLASQKTLTDTARRYSAAGQTLALVGHNPGIAILAHQLIEAGFDHKAGAVQRLLGNFKTGWAAAFEVRDEGVSLVQLFDPREG